MKEHCLLKLSIIYVQISFRLLMWALWSMGLLLFNFPCFIFTVMIDWFNLNLDLIDIWQIIPFLMINSVLNTSYISTWDLFLIRQSIILIRSWWAIKKSQLVYTDLVHSLCLIVLHYLDSFYRMYPSRIKLCWLMLKLLINAKACWCV